MRALSRGARTFLPSLVLIALAIAFVLGVLPPLRNRRARLVVR